MQQVRWQSAPIACVALGVAVVWCSALLAPLGSEFWRLGALAGGAMSLVGLVWFRRRITDEEAALRRLQQVLEQRQSGLDQQQRELDQARRDIETQLAAQVARVDRHEEEFAKKRIAFHGLLEFPEPLDLVEPDRTDAELSDLARKDQQMMRLLEGEAEIVFEKVRQNYYSRDGRFQPVLVRDEVYDLVQRVARIYQPDSDNALLETSIGQVVAAASRACLHFLIVLDELPLDVKQYNLQHVYTYIRKAVQTYGTYKAAEPYVTYAFHAARVGRWAMGANPFVLGASWIAGSLAKKGATSLASRLINRQAVQLLHDLVRVIGYEVAGVYGGRFRYRDANWIYCAELTDLLSRMPASRDSLARALREIAAIPLRNEYDRIYLLRLLAEQKSARPDRFRAAACLSMPERRAVAGQLEQFVNHVVQGRTHPSLLRWQQETEARLAVKLKCFADTESVPLAEQLAQATRSLAGVLLAVKQFEPDELQPVLSRMRVVQRMNDSTRAEVFQGLIENPPFFFEQPDVDPEGDVVGDYLTDLAQVVVGVEPFDWPMEALVVDAATYLRQPPKNARVRLDLTYDEVLRMRTRAGAEIPSVPAVAARAILSSLQIGELLRLLYDGVLLHHAEDDTADRGLWLVGTDLRLFALRVVPEPAVVWLGEPSVELDISSTMISSLCRLKGGTLTDREVSSKTELRISRQGFKRDSYFRPLADFLTERPQGSSSHAE